MAPTDRTPLVNARAALASARSTLIDALFTYEEAEGKVTESERLLPETSTDLIFLKLVRDNAKEAMEEARTAEKDAIDQLKAALATWLPDGTSPAEDLERLEASEPIVLFPVRLETRFDQEGGTDLLKVRVLPDELFLDTHEVALTEEEIQAAKDYYDELNEKNNEKELWRDFVARFGMERSAYILRQMLPAFGDMGEPNYLKSSSSCGGTIYGGKDEVLSYPTVQKKSDEWTRPGEAVLPDRWLVITYSDAGERKIFPGSRILEPLAMTPDPKLPDEDALSDLMDTTKGPYKVDDNIRWTVDYQRAVEVGMGVTITLDSAEAAAGFRRIIVVGVKSSMDAVDTSRHLEKLFDAHHYTDGLAIVGQGSPTKNMETQPTDVPPPADAGARSFAIERQRAPLDREYAHHCLPKDTDGYHLAAALGVPSGVMANIDRGYEKETRRGFYMNRALWPATLGYFMRHMMAAAVTGGEPVFSVEQTERARRYFERYVRPRGISPTFRRGATPYGVMPIASLAHWQPWGSEDDDNTEMGLLGPLSSLLEIWLENIDKIPQIRASPVHADVALAEVLSCEPSSQQFRVRGGVSDPAFRNAAALMGGIFDNWYLKQNKESENTFGRIGHGDWRPAIGRMQWKKAFNLSLPLIAEELSDKYPLPGFNFISGIAGADATELNTSTQAGKPEVASLLYHVLRHSTLAEYSRLAETEKSVEWRDWGVFGATSTTIIPSVYEMDAEGTLKPLADDHINALNRLSGYPSAELDRLFTETMDTASHRIDAWINAFAMRRLEKMRKIQEGSRLATRGDFLGGYGWLEDVRPKAHASVTLPDGRSAETRSTNMGHVHTPSMQHAAAAAVLRNGQKTMEREAPGVFAVDLSSERVRDAREIFEAVRNGQTVGAVLGYFLERGLRDNHPDVSELDNTRYDLRERFPLVANKNGVDGDEPAEAIAARNVVDGDALLRAYQAEPPELDFNSDPLLPSTSSDQYEPLIEELEKLSTRWDATSDLLTAEGTFQLVRGNIDAAIPTMQNTVDGAQPPVSVIAKSSRNGIGMDHKVALVFAEGSVPDLHDNWPDDLTARAEAEPILNAWLGEMVGDPNLVVCTVTYLDEEGEIITSTHDEGGTPVVKDSVIMRLSDLAIHPLDVFALAEVIAQGGAGSILDQRIVNAAQTDETRQPDETPATINVSYEVTDGGGERSFPQVLEALNAAHAVVAASRPLKAADVLSPAEAEEKSVGAEPVGGAGAVALFVRGVAAVEKLDEVVDLLEDGGTDEEIRLALYSAAELVPQAAVPPHQATTAALNEQSVAVREELALRRAKVPPGFASLPGATPWKRLVDHGTGSLKAVFGANFVAMPSFEPPGALEIERSFEARSTLLQGDERHPDKYLQRMMRTRERLGKYRKFNLYARSLGLSRPRIDVLQLPYVPDEKWLGLSFDTPPEEGRVATLLLNYSDGLDPAEAWSGLVVDDWTEIIPQKAEETGIALHYQGPQNQAPQAVLVATPSGAGAQWSDEELIGAIEQTLDLSKIRLLNHEYLDVGQALPASIFAQNPNIENSVSTTLGPTNRPAINKALLDG